MQCKPSQRLVVVWKAILIGLCDYILVMVVCSDFLPSTKLSKLEWTLSTTCTRECSSES